MTFQQTPPGRDQGAAAPAANPGGHTPGPDGDAPVWVAGALAGFEAEATDASGMVTRAPRGRASRADAKKRGEHHASAAKRHGAKALWGRWQELWNGDLNIADEIIAGRRRGVGARGAGRGPPRRRPSSGAAPGEGVGRRLERGLPEKMAALFTKDGVYEDHAFGAVFAGRDNVALWVEITTGAIDDARVEVRDAFRGGDKITVEWTFSGKDTRSGLAGRPPTGNSFSVPAVSVFEMRGNKIERVDDHYNLADLLGQLDRPSGAAEPSP